MKSIQSGFALLIVLAAAQGQSLTIDSADIAGWRGGIYFYKGVSYNGTDSMAISIGQNQTWDFSDFTSASLDTASREMPQVVIDSFPNANICYANRYSDFSVNQGRTSFEIFVLTNTSYGFGGGIHAGRGDLSCYRVQPPAAMLSLAASYGKQWTGESVTDTLRVQYSGEINSYGTMILPGGILEPVLGMRFHTAASVEGWEQLGVSYFWYSKERGLVASIQITALDDRNVFHGEGIHWVCRGYRLSVFAMEHNTNLRMLGTRSTAQRTVTRHAGVVFDICGRQIHAGIWRPTRIVIGLEARRQAKAHTAIALRNILPGTEE